MATEQDLDKSARGAAILARITALDAERSRLWAEYEAYEDDQPETTIGVEACDLNVEQIERLAKKHEAFGFGRMDERGLTTHGFDPEGLHAFVRELLGSRKSPAEPT